MDVWTGSMPSLAKGPVKGYIPSTEGQVEGYPQLPSPTERNNNVVVQYDEIEAR